MSNAQNYNKALGLAAQAHTDKYNTTKTRVRELGKEFDYTVNLEYSCNGKRL